MCKQFYMKNPHGRPSWDQYFMCIAKIVSSRSTCSVRKVGCIVVKDKRIIATGYNGAKPGEDHCIDNCTESKIYCKKREAKELSIFCDSLHAEENALKYIDENTIDVTGAAIYCTASPCSRCLKNIYDHGIKKVYYEYFYQSKNKVKEAPSEFIKAFETYSQIKITPENLMFFMDALMNVSSKRTLPSEAVGEKCNEL